MANVTNANHNQPPATTAERNLQQAADTAENSNWATARLIACSVEIGSGNGRPVKPRPGDEVSGKLSSAKAEKILGKSHNTVRAYLAAWNAAAAGGHCTPAADLTPEDGWAADMPAADLWETYRNPNSHSAKSETRTIPADPVAAVAQAMPKLTAEQKREIVAEVVKDDPTAAPPMTVEQKRNFVRREIEQSPEVAVEARKAVEARDAAAHEKWGPKLARVKEQSEADRKSSGTLVYLGAVVKLRAADRALADAISEVEGATGLTADHREEINELASIVERRLGAFKLIMAGETDWDAALADLTAGE